MIETERAVEKPLDPEVIRAAFERRTEVLIRCMKDERAQAIQRALCKEDISHFFNTFCVTYDPRVVMRDLPAYLPFDLFPRQVELVHWMDARVANAEEGLLEKSRDVGWTWVAAGYAVNKWLFVPGFRTTFGSRKVDLVDKLGDPDSILEKARIVIDRLPPWMLPDGWDRSTHALHCKIVNPENGNLIGGEGGAEMGRGGRATLYLLDEAAYIDHADSVAAAVLANSDCRIWASSVNGPGDLFARKRHDGTLREDQIFTFHYSDDPRKDAEWAAQKKRELSATPWMFAKEYDIDYSAAVEGICIPAAWVNSALKLGRLVHCSREGAAQRVGGLDVGDTCARSVLLPRFDHLITPPVSWGLPDTTQTALSALEAAKELGLSHINYDTIGVGKGVSSTLKLNPVEGLAVHAVNAGSPPNWQMIWPDGENSRKKFANLKMELWWLARERFKAAAEHFAFLTGEDVSGVEAREHDVGDTFVFEPAPSHAYRQLIVELSTPKRMFHTNGKIILESKKQLADRGVASPDFADALVLSLAPVDTAAIPLAAPIVVTVPRGFPELGGGAVPTRSAPTSPQLGGFRPAVSTGKRFDRDFSTDW